MSKTVKADKARLREQKAARKADAERQRRADMARIAIEKRDKKNLEIKRAAERKAQIAAQKAQRDKERAELRAAKTKLAAERQKKRQAVYGKIKAKLKNRKSGFDYTNIGILPRVELAVKGDRTSVTSMLSAAGIVILDIRSCGGETLFKLRKKDMRKAVAILRKMCYTTRINASYGVLKSLSFFAARCGLMIGACLAVIGLNISYGYIWRVQIVGNEVQSSAAIEAVLRSAGVKIGCKKSYGLSVLAAEALSAMPGIADASCEIVGTTLTVNVLESTEYSEPKLYPEYVAKYDATVTRIVLRSGTAKVARGDVVKRGDALANGEVFSTTGELMYTADCDAEVYGKIAVSFTAQIPITAIEYRRTGKTSTQTVYTLFGKQIGKAVSPYKHYDYAAHTSGYDLLLPLYVTTYKYYETAAVEYERDLTSAAESFAQEQIENMRFEGDFDYKYNITQTLPGLYTVHLFLTGETLISEGADTISDPTQKTESKDN